MVETGVEGSGVAMGVRVKVRQLVEPVIGRERTDRLRTAEVALRRRAVAALAGTRYQPPDPFATFAPPTHSRHQLLAGLHQRVRPEAYLEIGIWLGDSLSLARCPAVGIDPEFKITRELHGTVHLERTTSDEFFARADPLAALGGRPVDLALIDGMHLAEFALRDFINLERHMSPTGVVVFDDMLPRNPLEAARDRRTKFWTGDVYKVVGILRERRPDLVVLPVNARPTGMLVVLGLDPASRVLDEAYDALVPHLRSADPQTVPADLLDRSSSVTGSTVLESVPWDELLALRGSGAGEPALRAFLDSVAALPRLG